LRRPREQLTSRVADWLRRTSAEGCPISPNTRVHRCADLRGRAIRPSREYALMLWRAFAPGSCSRGGLESERPDNSSTPKGRIGRRGAGLDLLWPLVIS